MPDTLTLQSLPLFPLATVLYPGSTLGLRIFEVRYLDMIRRCHRTGAPFGVVCLTQGSEVRRPDVTEAFARVGTLAAIEALEAPQPALLELLASGTRRFRIRSSQRLPHGLWVADVELLAEDLPVAVPEHLRIASVALEKVIRQLRARVPPGDPPPYEPPWHLDDCSWVANRWCELLPLPAAHKQQLMELDNPLLRLELVNDVLGRSGITR